MLLKQKAPFLKNIWHVPFVHVNGTKAYAPRISRTICVPYVQDGCSRRGDRDRLADISTRSIVIRRASFFMRNYRATPVPPFIKI